MATPEQIERIRYHTLDGLPASRIASRVGLNSKRVCAIQRIIGLAEVAKANARRFKTKGLIAANPPRQAFGLHVDMGPTAAGDFVRLPRPDDLPPVTLSPAIGHGPRSGLLGIVLAFVVAFVGLTPEKSHAQAMAGAIAGRVVDSNRSPVGSAQVEFEHQASGHSPKRHTNNRGRYTQRGLRTDGPYRVWVYKPGYRWETALVNAPLLQTARYDVQLLRHGECQVPAGQHWRYRVVEREREPCNEIELLPPPEIEAAVAAQPTITTWVCESGRCYPLP